MLKEEYIISKKFTKYEQKLKHTLLRTSCFKPDEFFSERDLIMHQVATLETDIDRFSVYMPTHQMKPNIDKDIIQKLQRDIEEMFLSNFTKLDPEFALGNYKYATKSIAN